MGKAKSRTIGDILCDYLECPKETLEETPEDAVRAEDGTMRCFKVHHGYTIRDGSRRRWGFGKTEEQAWFAALSNLLGWNL